MNNCWNEIWKDILEKPDGSIDKEQLKKELSDFSDLIDRHSKLTMLLTDNSFSKVTYNPEAIDQYVSDLWEDRIIETEPEELIQNPRVKKLVEVLEYYVDNYGTTNIAEHLKKALTEWGWKMTELEKACEKVRI